jgi:uncharacterized protein YaiL (DUF2058 family)
VELLKDRIKFEAKIDVKSFEVLNSEFTKAKCYILYTGQNRNGSSISKEATEAALPSIYNCPVVAEMINKDDGEKDFGTHGGRIVIDSSGVRYEQTTVPYGVVPESANPRWEMVDDKEYLVCEIILWSGRYDDLDVFLADGVRPQSMEISPLEFEEKDNLFEIKSFEFSALTILGSDIEPCFENAKIETFECDTFKKQYEEMVSKFTQYLSSLDKKEEVKIEEEPKIFSLTMNQKLELLQDSIEDERVADEDDNTISYTSYWVMDADDDFAFIRVYKYEKDGKDSKTHIRAKYSINEENSFANIDKSSFEEIVNKWVTKTEAQEIEDSRQTMTIQIEQLQKDNELLQGFKEKAEKDERKLEINTVLDEFSVDLANSEEYKNFCDEALEKELSDDEIRKECFSILGKFKFEQKPKKDKEKPLATFVKPNTVNDKASERYGSAIVFFKPKN